MQSAEPTPLRYYSSPKDKLDFRRPRRRPFRVWPFVVLVMLMAGAIAGLMAFMQGDARPGMALLVPPSASQAVATGG